ncbi:MAG: PEP-CTERM sorting domain-containing protein [Akkermansia sp.]|nr:PEP-CTERM sorting domain-containing protein [Akkermansia sp.]
MKKTIIVLMTLAGIATADTVFTTNVSSDAKAKDATSTQSLTITEQLSVSVDSISKGSQYTSALRPDTNIGNGGTWTLTFTIKNDSSTAVAFDEINLGVFLFNSDGNKQGSDVTRSIDFTLTAADDTTTYTLLPQVNYVLKGNDANDTLATTVKIGSTAIAAADQVANGVNVNLSSPFEMEASKSYTFNLTVTKDTDMTGEWAKGTFVGLNSITFSADPIPEPTTATLSLLALAGLAARRRRR